MWKNTLGFETVEHGCDEKVKISKILWDCPFKEIKR
jgi:hypothetical protein